MTRRLINVIFALLLGVAIGGDEFGSVTVQGSNQLLISVLKQKLGASNFARWVFYDPIYNKLDELELGNRTAGER